nr:HEPN domain-containing protein [uncultured Sediminibacterium sp.]
MDLYYYKAIIFCSNPLEGVYTYKDKFQIYPLKSEHAPFNDKVRHYPIVLEYMVEYKKDVPIPKGFEEVKNMMGKMTNSGNKIKEITSLLTAFSNYRFFQNTVTPQYFFELPEGEITEEINKQSSKGGLNIYLYPEFQKEASISKLSKVDFPKVEEAQHPDCFMHFDTEGKEPIKFTRLLFAALHNYYALHEADRKAVYSTISLIGNGAELRETTKSLSFISLVSSIETMVNHEYKEIPVEKCKECGSDIYKVAAKFRDYLLRYVSNNEKTKKEIDKIYSLRSKIAHAGQLLLGDNLIDWSNDIIQNEQWQIHIQIMQVARVSTINWVLFRANPPSDRQFAKPEKGSVDNQGTLY